MNSNMGVEDVVANSLSGLSFSGFTILMVVLIAGALWCAVPIMLFLMKRRIGDLERIMEENTALLSNDLRRVTDILLIDRMQASRSAEAAKQATATGHAQPADHSQTPASEWRMPPAANAPTAQTAPRFIAPRVIQGGGDGPSAAVG